MSIEWCQSPEEVCSDRKGRQADDGERFELSICICTSEGQYTFSTRKQVVTCQGQPGMTVQLAAPPGHDAS